MSAKPSANPRLHRVLALVLVLWTGQLGAILHAGQHLFHPASALCDAYFSVQNGAAASPAPPPSPIATPLQVSEGPSPPPSPFRSERRPHQSRAPPLPSP